MLFLTGHITITRAKSWHQTQPAFTCSKSIMKTPEECKICSKFTITTRERHQRRSGVFNVKFEQISLVLMLPLLTLNKYAYWVLCEIESLSVKC